MQPQWSSHPSPPFEIPRSNQTIPGDSRQQLCRDYGGLFVCVDNLASESAARAVYVETEESNEFSCKCFTPGCQMRDCTGAEGASRMGGRRSWHARHCRKPSGDIYSVRCQMGSLHTCARPVGQICVSRMTLHFCASGGGGSEEGCRDAECQPLK